MTSASPTVRTWLIAVSAALAIAAAAAIVTLLAYATSAVIVAALVLSAVAGAALLAYPMLGVYAGVLAAPLEFLNLQVGAVGLSSSEVVFAATAASFLLHGLARDRAHPFDAAHLAFGALIGVAALGLTFARDTTIVLKVIFDWSVFLTLSIMVSRASKAELRLLFMSLTLSAGIVGAMAVAGAGDTRLLEGGAIAEGRARAAFNHPNILAFFLVLALSPALVLALRERGWRRPPLVIAAGLIFAALLLTLSRGAIFGAAASLLVMLWWVTFRRLAVLLLVVLIAFTALNLNPIARSREVAIVSERLGTVIDGREARTNPRLRIYKRAPGIVADHPFVGVGEGNFSRVSALYDLRDRGGEVFEHAHNVPLTIAAETGLLGLSAFLLFLFFLARRAATILRHRAADVFPLGLAVIAALTGLLANSMTDYPLRQNLVMAVLMIEVGALIAYARLAREPAPG